MRMLAAPRQSLHLHRSNHRCTMKTLIVDDHALFRDGLTLLLARINPQIQTVDAGDLPAALRVACQHPDIGLVLFDLGLPGIAGMEALSEFRRLNAHLPVVVLSGLLDRRTVMEALERGAMGFIPKTTSSQALAQALKVVLDGGIYLPASALEFADFTASAPPAVPMSKHLSELDLTQRQMEVFKLIVQGRPNKLIARELGVSESTVKSHIKPILKALNVTSRVGAIVAVGRQRLLLD
jgi:DNA-binding NarL/FixJ family response regulator